MSICSVVDPDLGPLPSSLGALLDRLARDAPESIAFHDRDQPLTYAQLARESLGLAAGLAGLGVRTGDRVAIWLPNIPSWFVSFFACAHLGAIAVAINTRFRSGEISDIVARSGARIAIYWPGFKGIDFAGLLEGADRDAFSAVAAFIAYREDDAQPPSQVHGIPSYDYHTLAGCPPVAASRGEAERGCVIFTTSGTTRAPKFVLHSQRSIMAHAFDVVRGLGIAAPDAVVMPAVPFCGVTGFCQAIAAIAAGRPIVGSPAFQPEEAARLINRYRVTHTAALGDMAANLLAAAPPGERPFPSLRVVGFAAFSPTQMMAAGQAEARGVPLLGLYGSSEVQAIFSCQPAGLPAGDRVCGGGWPMSPSARVRVRDLETGELLPAGHSGELEFAGPSLMSGYFANPEATEKALTGDGFFRSGDLGFMTGDGRFVYQSRMGDVLRLAGFLVSPAEIEAYLKEHPAVADAQVVGIETGGAPRAVAFVIAKAGICWTETELIAHCRQRMANYKVPVRVLPIGDFPVAPSANGNKIHKASLRAIAEAALQANS